MTSTLRFAQVVVDCENAAKLAGFYSELLGRPIGEGTNEFFAVIPGSADPPFPNLMFLQVPEPRNGKNRLHFDLVTDDKEEAIARAIELGASRFRGLRRVRCGLVHPDRPGGERVRHRRTRLVVGAFVRRQASATVTGQGSPGSVTVASLERTPSHGSARRAGIAWRYD